jgi:hypothetical protein
LRLAPPIYQRSAGKDAFIIGLMEIGKQNVYKFLIISSIKFLKVAFFLKKKEK